MRNLILPSIIAKDAAEFEQRFNLVKRHSTWFHLDLMDGKFVKNKSLTFPLKKLNLKKKYPYKKFCTHLMLNNPLPWIKQNLNHVDSVSFHLTNEMAVKKIINYLKNTKNFKKTNTGKKVKKPKIGIVLSPSISIEKLQPILNSELNIIDKVIIMSVIPGQYGAKFIKKTIPKIKKLRKLYPNLKIQVDGAVSNKNIAALKKAGANYFVVGSYLQNSNDVKKDIRKLRSLIKNKT